MAHRFVVGTVEAMTVHVLFQDGYADGSGNTILLGVFDNVDSAFAAAGKGVVGNGPIYNGFTMVDVELNKSVEVDLD